MMVVFKSICVHFDDLMELNYLLEQHLYIYMDLLNNIKNNFFMLFLPLLGLCFLKLCCFCSQFITETLEELVRSQIIHLIHCVDKISLRATCLKLNTTFQYTIFFYTCYFLPAQDTFTTFCRLSIHTCYKSYMQLTFVIG